MATDRQDPDYRKARRAYLLSYDRAIPTLRQADHCIGCGQCMVHCQQTIKIPERSSPFQSGDILRLISRPGIRTA